MEPLSKETIRKLARSRDPYERTAARYGKRVARKLHGVFRKQERAEVARQVVYIDHTQVDVFPVDDDGNLLPRPYLTVVFDDATNDPLGFALSFCTPSAAQVLEALRHAILPKTYTRALVPEYLDLEWESMGLPDTIVVDNGMDLNSASVVEACLAQGISIITMPPNEPWKKGRAERFFRTLNTTLFHRLPGTTFGGKVA
jgi:putative transposase